MSDADEVTRLRAALAVSQAATEAAISEATRQALSSAEFDAMTDRRILLETRLRECAVGFGEVLEMVESRMWGDAEDWCKHYREWAERALDEAGPIKGAK